MGHSLLRTHLKFMQRTNDSDQTSHLGVTTISLRQSSLAIVCYPFGRVPSAGGREPSYHGDAI